MQPGHEVKSAWRASAPFWEKHREIIRQMFAPVTQALVEDGLIASGNTVLDIASGPGEPAFSPNRTSAAQTASFSSIPVSGHQALRI
jgi:hypothetical protein